MGLLRSAIIALLTPAALVVALADEISARLAVGGDPTFTDGFPA